MFSFARSVHSTLKSIFANSYVLSRYVPNMKQWMIRISMVNGVVNVRTCFGWTSPYVILLYPAVQNIRGQDSYIT